MSTQSTSKKRVLSAASVVSLAAAGLALSGLSDSNMQLRAAKPGRPPDAAVTRVSHDATENVRVGIVARRVGWGRYTIDSVTDTATPQSSDSSTTGDSGSADDPTLLPRKVVVGLPSYEGGRPPSATAPTVERGTSPSVDPGWTTTVDLGELPSIGSPSVDPGERGTLHWPTVEAS